MLRFFSMPRRRILGLIFSLPGLLALMPAVAQQPAGAQPLILIYGDSLSAEYGLKRGAGWVALLQEQLSREGYPHRIMNVSISGETTAGGLSRFEESGS